MQRLLSAGHGHAIVEQIATDRRGKPIHCKITFTPLLNNPKRAMNGVLLLMEPQLAQDDDTPNTTASR